MENNSKQAQQRQLTGDETVYVPDELYHSFHNVLEMLKEAQYKLHRVRGEIKSSEESKIENS